MERILVTGGSGFVGRYLIRRLLKVYPDVEVTSLSRSEGGISKLLSEVSNPRLSLKMVDVRDYDCVRCALKGKDTVLHLAAMKRVELCEEQCEEAASINVLGTINMLKGFEGNTFILMSTDKAVEPCNCYGATKLVAEKLVMERASVSKGPRYMVIRSGNVMGSTGSVLDIWTSQIRLKNEITVTDPNMKRFYVPVDKVIDLYIAVLERGENHKIYFTPDGDPIVLKDMVAEALRQYGNDQTKVRYIGLRMGERMEEKMRLPTEENVVCNFLQSVQQPVSTT